MEDTQTRLKRWLDIGLLDEEQYQQLSRANEEAGDNPNKARIFLLIHQIQDILKKGESLENYCNQINTRLELIKAFTLMDIEFTKD